MDKQKRIKIFIADDHPVIVHGIKCILAEHLNITIVGTASSSNEMFKRLSPSHPTVLLLDLNMPGSDFYDNIARAKKEVPWAKIIIFSEHYTPELVKSLIQSGVHGYVAKESKPEDLIEAIGISSLLFYTSCICLTKNLVNLQRHLPLRLQRLQYFH